MAAIWATRLLVALAPLDLPRRANIEFDWKVAAIVTGVGVFSGLMAAFVPSVWAARASLASVVGATTLRGAGGAGRMRRSLIVAQVALSLVLLSTGALVVRSFAGLVSTDPGFRSEGVLTLFLNLSPFLPDPNNAFAFEERVEKSLEALPGVTGASATWTLPLSGSASMGRISFPGAPGNTGDSERDRPLVDFIATRAGYVKVMGMRLVEGREFSDARSDVHEALIDRHLAEQFFPTGSPLGATIRYLGVSLTVVGVVEQARIYDVYQDGRPQLFGRVEDLTPFAPYYVVLRTKFDLIPASGRDLSTPCPPCRPGV
ncbi:MAG TPA: ABC transporter permease, partial [Gammaproteobacteria bacterium]|nr:ABC transporter permease [Gammaproteobacteria bacterium]